MTLRLYGDILQYFLAFNDTIGVFLNQAISGLSHNIYFINESKALKGIFLKSTNERRKIGLK